MRKRHTGLYHALVILPDRLFPFKTKVHGQWVRGIRSYDARLARYQRLYGRGHYGYRLGAYRQLFHFIGSLLFLVTAAYISKTFFGSDGALPAFLIAALFLVSFQEFYLHRRMYQQLWKKGILDWLVWCVPFGVYVSVYFH